MEKEGFWEDDLFEEAVDTSLVALYETAKVAPLVDFGPMGRIDKRKMTNENDLASMRSFGASFVTPDRVMCIDEYWDDGGGLPKESAYTSIIERGDGFLSGYAEMHYIKKISKVPRWVKMIPAKYAAKYAIMTFYPQRSGGVFGVKNYGGVTSSGRLVVASAKSDNRASCLSYQAILASCLWYGNDMKKHWNVCAAAGDAKANFMVYEDQVKSLFFARDLPTTITGRKKPILHWVAAHKRRMKERVSIDVRKHLRGCNVFEMNGTNFTITQPLKMEA